MPTTHDDKVALLIDGRKFEHWSEIEVHHQMDGISTVTAKGPFEADRSEFREAFRPYTFKPLTVLIDDAPVLLGVLVGVDPDSDATSSTVDVSGYSKPGAMADCASPEDSLPLEFRKLGLKDIARTLAEPFGVSVRFDASEGARFAKAKAEVDQRPYAFLGELARQRNLIVTNDVDGTLVFLRSGATGNPVARLRAGSSPVTRVAMSSNPQGYYSQITGFTKHKRGRRGSRHTARNPWLSGVLRPMSFKIDDTDNGDAPEAVAAKLGRMFANTASYSLTVSTWRDPGGKLWEKNTTVTLVAPNAMIYSESEFLIRSVTFTKNSTEKRTTLELVLPGAFTGEIPEVLPWNEADT